MNLKALATQLECQGVDPGYIQRFDWEKWILDKPSDRPVDDPPLFPASKRARSLVLYLLQKYLKVVDPLYIQSLREDLDETRSVANTNMADLKRMEKKLEQSTHELETLKGTLRSLDLRDLT